MTRPTRVGLVLALAFTSGFAATAATAGDAARARIEPASRPNIIFILVDDLRWDQLGCTGHPLVKTPHIDRIGAEGVIFRNAFVCTPLCSPSRASFLTGRYPHAHRIINNDRNGLDSISHALVTFPRMLRETGYETAFIGKWHMGGDDTRRPGFDFWLSFRGQGLFIDPVLNVDGRRRQCRGYMTDLLNQYAVRFVQKPRASPFLLYLSHKAVHYPFLPAPRHESLYCAVDYVPPPSAGDLLAGKPVLRRPVAPPDILRLAGATPEPGEPRRGRGDQRADIIRDHLRCLAAVDEGVGMLFEALVDSDQLDRTLIIFSSDNGFLFGEHGLFSNKRMAYEESLRVPLLMRYPASIRPGSVRDQMVLNIDIAPTVLELAGVTVPPALHGVSLVGVLGDEHAAWRSSFLAEYYLEKVAPRYPDWQAVRTEQFKYIHYPTLGAMDELYDLQADPWEMNNLVGTAAGQETVRRMQQELANLQATTR